MHTFNIVLLFLAFMLPLAAWRILVLRRQKHLAQRYVTMVEQASDIILLQDEQFRILEANARALACYGYTLRELRAMPSAIELRAPAERGSYLADTRALMGDTGTMYETLHQRKDGSTFPVEGNSRAIVIDGQRYLLAVIRDISARKQVERERDGLAQAVAATNRELEDLVFVASHDLRTPLLNVHGFGRRLDTLCGELRRHLAAVEPAGTRAALASLVEVQIPKALQFVLAGSEQMDRLINGLLRLSRLGRGALRVERLDMNRVAQEAVALHAFSIQSADATVSVEPLPACLGDRTLVIQILANLLDNALKYCDPARPLRVTVTGRADGARAVYCVADNGIGIDPDDQKRVWDVFCRLQPDGPVGGEGLGLCLVRRAAERLQGTTWLESARQEGSRFFVSLPRAASDSVQP